MTIINLLLIVVVLGIAVLMIYFHINSQKNAEVVTKMDVDDQTYTLNKMIEFIKRRLDEITKINLYDIGLSEEELKKFKINIVDYTSSFGFAILGLILSSISLTFIFTNNINIITIILSSICIIPLSISLIECFTFYFSSRLGKMILSISAIISLVLFFFILSRNVKMFIPFSIIFSLIVYPLLNIFTYLKSKYFSIEQNSKFIKF